ncbi:MAG: precorrin-2 C(20)-methyltransferase [Pseudomonadota bacterium]
MNSTLYGIGVGPGDPELLTLKALRLIRACPVLAYMAPEQGDSLARAVAAPHLPGGQVEVAIRMPLAPDRFPSGPVFERAAAALGAHLDAGRDVAALCLGDPFLYGSFMYLFARLCASHRVAVVPGVSSLMAAAAALGRPLAARDDVLCVIPASLPDAAIAARLAACEGAAIVKLGRHFARIRALLERAGLAQAARYIEHASMANERQPPLAEIDPAGVPYFSLILVHRRGEAWR